MEQRSGYVRLRVELLQKVCRDRPGLWDDLWAAGQLAEDSCEVSTEDFDRINKAHFSAFSPGEIVHTLAKPIAKVFGLADCNDCAEGRIELNAG